jgi:hypothetical protein
MARVNDWLRVDLDDRFVDGLGRPHDAEAKQPGAGEG